MSGWICGWQEGQPVVVGGAPLVGEVGAWSPEMQRFIDAETSPVWAILRTASTALSAYHGYKRNQSIGWAIGWALLGGAFPVIVPAIALAQGFGKRAG